MLVDQLVARQRRDRRLAAADRVAVGRIAAEEQPVVHSFRDRVWVVAQPPQVRQALLAHPLNFVLRETRVRDDVGQQLQRLRPVTRQHLGRCDEVLAVHADVRSRRDEVTLLRDLQTRPILRALGQQSRREGRKAGLIGRVRGGAAGEIDRRRHRGHLALLDEQQLQPVRQVGALRQRRPEAARPARPRLLIAIDLGRCRRHLLLRRHDEPHSSRPEVLRRDPLHVRGRHRQIALEVLVQPARVAREDVVVVQQVGAAAEAAHAFELPHVVRLQTIDGALHLFLARPLRFYQLDLLEERLLDRLDARARRHHRVKTHLSRDLHRRVGRAHVARDLLLVYQRAVETRAAPLTQDREEDVQRRLVRVEARRRHPRQVEPR